MSDLGTCRSCNKPIIWIKTNLGNTTCIDPDPVEGGNIVILNGVAHTLRKDLFEQAPEGPRFVSHFATCSFAQKHRKPHKRGQQ